MRKVTENGDEWSFGEHWDKGARFKTRFRKRGAKILNTEIFEGKFKGSLIAYREKFFDYHFLKNGKLFNVRFF